MLNVLKYIWNKNSGINKIKYLILGVLFQIFKRLTKSIISKKYLMGRKYFYIQTVMYQVCMLIQIYQIKERLVF